MLSSAYFKATKKFFAPSDFRQRDVEHVAAQLSFSETRFDFADYGDRTRQRHQALILKFYGFRAFDHQMRHFLIEEIDCMVSSLPVVYNRLSRHCELRNEPGTCRAFGDVRKGISEARACGDLQQDLWQLDSW